MRPTSWEHVAKSSASGHHPAIPSYKTQSFVTTQETATSSPLCEDPDGNGEAEKMKQDMKQELELMRNDIRKAFSDGMEASKKEIIGLGSRVEALEEEITKLKSRVEALETEAAKLTPSVRP